MKDVAMFAAIGIILSIIYTGVVALFLFEFIAARFRD